MQRMWSSRGMKSLRVTCSVTTLGCGTSVFARRHRPPHEGVAAVGLLFQLKFFLGFATCITKDQNPIVGTVAIERSPHLSKYLSGMYQVSIPIVGKPRHDGKHTILPSPTTTQGLCSKSVYRRETKLNWVYSRNCRQRHRTLYIKRQS